MSRKLTLLAALGGALLCAPPATAATLTRAPDGALVLSAASGASDHVFLASSTGDAPESDISIEDTAGLTENADGCTQSDELLVNCRLDPAGMRIALGDGDDLFRAGFSYPSDHPIAVDGGPGDDEIDGDAERDSFDGGPGDDTVDGEGGADVVRGGEGDDTLIGDHYESPAPDLIDGGPGVDTVQDDWTDSAKSKHPDVTLTLAGGADDGRPGEGDDVENVEDVVVNQGGTLTGTDAPEHLEAFQTDGSVHISGYGGDDTLKGSGGPDTIDGGAGNDNIDAGFGDDTITGGPGRDQIAADTRGGDCGPVWCTFPYGNDVVDARDGEVDSIDCGYGADTVYADPIDVVAPNCETVVRSSAPAPAAAGAKAAAPAAGATTPAATAGTHRATTSAKPTGTARCHVPAVRGLTAKTARRKVAAAGCTARVRGHGRHVRRQSRRPGTWLKHGSVVRLTLG